MNIKRIIIVDIELNPVFSLNPRTDNKKQFDQQMMLQMMDANYRVGRQHKRQNKIKNKNGKKTENPSFVLKGRNTNINHDIVKRTFSTDTAVSRLADDVCSLVFSDFLSS